MTFEEHNGRQGREGPERKWRFVSVSGWLRVFITFRKAEVAQLMCRHVPARGRPACLRQFTLEANRVIIIIKT